MAPQGKANPFCPQLPRGPDRQRVWGSLSGSAVALAIAHAAREHGGPLLLITPDTMLAQQLEAEIGFYAGGKRLLPVLVFPDWETLPYDAFSPHRDIVSQRLETLYRLPGLASGVVIVPIATLMHRLAPHTFLNGHCLVMDVGERLDLEELRTRLQRSGYRCVAQVMEHGEFAVRGSLIDLFPMGSATPYRIDLLDDEIDSIRCIDVESQRSGQRVERVRLLPAQEFPLTQEGITGFRRAWRAAFSGDPGSSTVYRDISQGIASAGIEYYAPLFFDETHTLFDYLPDTALVLRWEGVETAAEKFWHEATQRFEQLGLDPHRPLLPPTRLFLQAPEVFAACARFSQIHLRSDPVTEHAGGVNYATAPLPDVSLDRHAERTLHRLADFLSGFAGRTLICAESPGRRESLIELLARNDLHPVPCSGWQEFMDGTAELAITVAAVETGLLLPEIGLAVLAEGQLFGERVLQRRRRQRERDPETIIRDLTELRIGAPVVHIDHGVGRYLGLQVLHIDNREGEFLTIEYAGGDRLYVPVASLHFINRYTGVDPEHAPLHRLGTDQWTRAKRKAAEKVRDVAAELLDLYARRAARKGYAFPPSASEYERFAAEFPFEETPDQLQAIEQVMRDLRSSVPMDRVVCGDVGFGKTEVAMRAAFLVVHGGKQVAILVPTTLLAQQHYANFRDRFVDWPVRVETLSRFRSSKEQEQVLQGLTDGRVDIVIGTHKLLQREIRFKALGLVIIDEEHRFGVRQKEKLKSLRAEVEVLTLTATPIPRTLNMAMSGLRDLSIIATPPARRLSIKTFVREASQPLVREAILREVHRGGQVYYLHNEVKTIEHTARDLANWVPEARIAIAHGQMPERQLERIMSDFYHRRFNVLVCTTIIETGIDIPTANTMIIDRADKLGLAQLHQLRGRVGRSHHQAYAYLFTPARDVMTDEARKRLEAIESLEDLGSGFALATHDLEIRGAGELLGEDQSGNMEAVGFTLYMEMLERAIAALQQGREPELEGPGTYCAEVDLHIPALIPEDYLADVQTRLTLYKRLASARTPSELRELQIEMIDRFGLLPAAAKNLFQVTELKLKAERLGASRVEAGPQGGRIVFADKPALDPTRLVELIQAQPQVYRLDQSQSLRFKAHMEQAEARIRLVDELLSILQRREAA